MNKAIKIFTVFVCVLFCPLLVTACKRKSSKNDFTNSNDIQAETNLSDGQTEQLNTFNNISLNGKTITYDGEPHTLHINGELPSGSNIIYNLGSECTEVGIYTVSISITHPDYQTVNLSQFLTIVPCSVRLDVQPQLMSYDGSIKALDITSVDKTQINVSGDTASSIGQHIATFSLKDKKNYIWSDGSVEDKTIVWTIIGRVDLVYDGQTILTIDYGDSVEDINSILSSYEFASKMLELGIEDMNIYVSIGNYNVCIITNEYGTWKLSDEAYSNFMTYIDGYYIWTYYSTGELILFSGGNYE